MALTSKEEIIEHIEVTTKSPVFNNGQYSGVHTEIKGATVIP